MYLILHKAGDAVMSLQSTVFPSAHINLLLLGFIEELSSFDFSTVSDDALRIPFFSAGDLGAGSSKDRLLGFRSSFGFGRFQISCEPTLNRALPKLSFFTRFPPELE